MYTITGQRCRAHTGISQQCIYFKLQCPRSGITAPP
uniref:Uncharacterized protein n=1 Tax=Siphoviridae sp. ctTrD1 TaxID=2825524 RepID=A0A8S5PR78_9CAUD|nr:MAG TPA: hypothetical protein [Siphoviridae sp. ctTrD1]